MTIDEQKAVLVIRNYLNKDLSDVEIMSKYSLAIDQLIQNAKKLETMKITGVSSMSEGNQSISFVNGVEAWTVTPDVKALLPVPYVRMY